MCSHFICFFFCTKSLNEVIPVEANIQSFYPSVLMKEDKLKTFILSKLKVSHIISHNMQIQKCKNELKSTTNTCRL